MKISILLVAISMIIGLALGQVPCADEGGVCGGFAGVQCCTSDLTCNYDMGSAGHCVKQAQSNSVPCVNEGEVCGGFAGVQCCSSDLTCNYDMGSAGHCVKQTTVPCANEGGVCGGFAGVQCCSSDLTCNYDMGSAGHCVKPAQARNVPCVNEGGVCGGFAGVQCCSSDLTCNYDMGSAGHCVKANGVPCAPEGGVCGGFAGVQCCSSDLTCNYDMGSAGHCVKTNGVPCAQDNEICGGFAGVQCCSSDSTCVYDMGSAEADFENVIGFNHRPKSFKYDDIVDFKWIVNNRCWELLKYKLQRGDHKYFNLPSGYNPIDGKNWISLDSLFSCFDFELVQLLVDNHFVGYDYALVRYMTDFDTAKLVDRLSREGNNRGIEEVMLFIFQVYQYLYFTFKEDLVSDPYVYPSINITLMCLCNPDMHSDLIDCYFNQYRVQKLEFILKKIVRFNNFKLLNYLIEKNRLDRQFIEMFEKIGVEEIRDLETLKLVYNIRVENKFNQNNYIKILDDNNRETIQFILDQVKNNTTLFRNVEQQQKPYSITKFIIGCKDFEILDLVLDRFQLYLKTSLNGTTLESCIFKDLKSSIDILLNFGKYETLKYLKDRYRIKFEKFPLLQNTMHKEYKFRDLTVSMENTLSVLQIAEVFNLSNQDIKDIGHTLKNYTINRMFTHENHLLSMKSLVTTYEHIFDSSIISLAIELNRVDILAYFIGEWNQCKDRRDKKSYFDEEKEFILKYGSVEVVKYLVLNGLLRFTICNLNNALNFWCGDRRYDNQLDQRQYFNFRSILDFLIKETDLISKAPDYFTELVNCRIGHFNGQRINTT
eukprot:gene3967-4962_t